MYPADRRPLTGGGPPPVQRLGVAVLLQGPAVVDAAYLVGVAVTALSRRDGIQPIARWLALHRALTSAMSDAGRADIPESSDEPQLAPEQLISTTEVAAMLQITERQARRLAADLCARRAGRALVFDRGAVQAEAARRRLLKEGD